MATNEPPAKFKLNDLFIRDEFKQLVRLSPNEVQSDYLDKIAPGWNGDKIEFSRLREIILKSRKQGFSTLILALFFLDTINTPNTYTVVIAHNTEATIDLFEIVKTFYNNLPGSKPDPQYASRRGYFWPALNSRFFVGTAGAADFGRGTTLNNIHASEVASWPDGEKIATGLFQAVPKDGNIFIESTAQGIGNFYHDEYENAQRGESVYVPRFVAWYESKKYSTPAPADFTPQIGTYEQRGESLEYLPSDEEKLIAAGVNFDQLQWRREKLRESGMRRKFKQEYPATVREAFISSGACYFDLEKLEDLVEQLKSDAFNPIEFEVPVQYLNLSRAPRASGRYLVEEARESLMLWEASIAGEIYVIGADTAEGINTRGDHDYQSASVWRVSNSTEVARLHGRFDKHVYGLMLAELGQWYNTALLGIERNNTGGAVINAALFAARYPEGAADNSRGLYMHQEYDEKKAPRERRAGYPTTQQSKFFILDELATAIESGEFHPRSRELVADLQRYVKLPGGKAGAETGHDDRVIDAAIARRMMNLRPRKAREFFFNVE